MKSPNKLTAIISVFIFLTLAACGGANQIEEAARLVAEADKKVVEADEMVKKTEKKNKELFAVYIETDEELQDYKQEMSAKATRIVEDFEKASDLVETASGKFAEAAKLNVAEEFRSYLETKSLEFAKRAEAVNARKENARTFLEYDGAAMIRKFEENNERTEKLLAEAAELGEKADQIKRENGDIFYAKTQLK